MAKRNKKEPINLTVECIPPNISNVELKSNIERFYNILCRVAKIENFNHCEYDIEADKIHIILNRRKSL